MILVIRTNFINLSINENSLSLLQVYFIFRRGHSSSSSASDSSSVVVKGFEVVVVAFVVIGGGGDGVGTVFTVGGMYTL